MERELSPDQGSEGPFWGVVAALPIELGPLRQKGEPRPSLGVACRLVEAVEQPVLTAVSGVGKVAAAHAASALVALGVRGILVVGTCGGLDPRDRIGDFVHASRAVQWDLGVRAGRESGADERLLAAWREVAGGEERTFLTADRAALRTVDRARRARALRRAGGHVPVAEMETAAVAAVASRAGIPWAGLRVISDQRLRLRDLVTAQGRSKGRFMDHFERVAGQPADTIGALLRRLQQGDST